MSDLMDWVAIFFLKNINWAQEIYVGLIKNQFLVFAFAITHAPFYTTHKKWRRG